MLPTVLNTATRQPTFSVQPSPGPTTCFDSDNGALDEDGDGCAGYDVDDCGEGDDYDFTAADMCCLCGGGYQSKTQLPTSAPTASQLPTVTPAPTMMYDVSTFAELEVCETLPGAWMSIAVASIAVTDEIYLVTQHEWRITGNAMEGGAVLDGGGETQLFYVRNGARLMLEHLWLINGGNTKDGGAIRVRVVSSEVIVNSCTLSDNTAIRMGGAAFTQYFAKLKLWNSTLIRNSAGQTGGAVESDSHGDFKNCWFISNSCSGSYAQDGSGHGGAINMREGKVIDCTFQLNSAAGSGGALRTAGDVAVQKCHFDTNTAAKNGGGVYTTSGDLSIEMNSVFSNCVATVHGGGIYAEEGTISITVGGNSSFSSCVASTGNGAALFSMVSAEVEDTAIRDFTASTYNSSVAAFYHDASAPNYLKLRPGTIFEGVNLLYFDSSEPSTVIVMNLHISASATDFRSGSLLTCRNESMGDFCPNAYCSDVTMGVECYCFPDGVRTDPSSGASCRSSAEMPMLLLGSEKTQRLTLYKDAIGVTNLFFSNTGDVPLAWNLAVTANSESLLWVLSSTSGTLSSGIMQQVAISLDLTALQARAKEYRTELTLNTSSPTPTPVPISATTGVVISTVVSASPDAMRSNVTIKNVSTIAASSAVEFAVLPVDSTGLAILDASQIAYTAQLRAPESTVIACSVAYDAASDSHRGTCTPPSLIAGEFAIDVLDAVGSLVGNQSHAFYISACPETYFLDPEDSVCKCVAGSFDHGSYCDLCPGGTIAEMAGKDTCTECPIRRTSGPDRTRCECEEGYFLENEECVLCPDKVTCAWNSTVADWVLDPGVWRLNPVSKDLRDCRFGDASCPGVTASDDGCTARGFGGWPHCGCGYAGPTCAVCAPNYFLSWAGNSCQECGSSDSHTPSIVLGCVLVVVGGLAAAVVRTIKAKESFSWVAPLKALSRLGRTKASILFYVCQVISAFASISSDTGDKGHPEPAATFAGALGASNVEFLQFVPMSCIASGTTDFYWKMCMRALVAPAAISVLWLWPLSCIARGKPYARAVAVAAKLSLTGLEVITPSVATNAMQTFACSEFNDKWFLRAELTIPCDGSARRQKWTVAASLLIVAYPIGVPLLLFTTMYLRKDEINRLQQALKQNDSEQIEVISAKRLTARLSVKERRPSIVASVDYSLLWIVKKVELFNPGRWPFAAFLLLLRIMQTSVLVLIPTQNMQAAAASALAVLGACVLQETRPYRRSSDTEVAVAAQYCVFCWCFSIILRDMGISDQNTLTAMGIALIVATAAVFTFAIKQSIAEASALRSERQAPNVSTPTDEESHTDGSPDDVDRNDDEGSPDDVDRNDDESTSIRI